MSNDSTEWWKKCKAGNQSVKIQCQLVLLVPCPVGLAMHVPQLFLEKCIEEIVNTTGSPASLKDSAEPSKCKAGNHSVKIRFNLLLLLQLLLRLLLRSEGSHAFSILKYTKHSTETKKVNSLNTSWIARRSLSSTTSKSDPRKPRRKCPKHAFQGVCNWTSWCQIFRPWGRIIQTQSSLHSGLSFLPWRRLLPGCFSCSVDGQVMDRAAAQHCCD